MLQKRTPGGTAVMKAILTGKLGAQSLGMVHAPPEYIAHGVGRGVTGYFGNGPLRRPRPMPVTLYRSG